MNFYHDWPPFLKIWLRVWMLWCCAHYRITNYPSHLGTAHPGPIPGSRLGPVTVLVRVRWLEWERESWAQSLALRQTDSVLIGLSGSKQSPYTRFCPLRLRCRAGLALVNLHRGIMRSKLFLFQELNAVYNITKDQDVNLVPAQPHILHNLTGEAGDTSALPPNLHQTYFEGSLMYFTFDVDNVVVRVTALACTRSSLTPINWRTTSTRSRSVKFRSTNDNKWTRNLSL